MCQLAHCTHYVGGTINRYAYALNNPIRYADPSGYQTAPAKTDCSQEGTCEDTPPEGTENCVGDCDDVEVINDFSDSEPLVVTGTAASTEQSGRTEEEMRQAANEMMERMLRADAGREMILNTYSQVMEQMRYRGQRLWYLDGMPLAPIMNDAMAGSNTAMTLIGMQGVGRGIERLVGRNSRLDLELPVSVEGCTVQAEILYHELSKLEKSGDLGGWSLDNSGTVLHDFIFASSRDANEVLFLDPWQNIVLSSQWFPTSDYKKWNPFFLGRAERLVDRGFPFPCHSTRELPVWSRVGLQRCAR